MERESFENDDIAKVMNEHFVNIKVDREERPDIDRIYMTYIQVRKFSFGDDRRIVQKEAGTLPLTL